MSGSSADEQADSSAEWQFGVEDKEGRGKGGAGEDGSKKGAGQGQSWRCEGVKGEEHEEGA